MDRVALRSLQIVAVHSVFVFGVADYRLDGGSSAQIAFDGFSDAALLAADVDFELVIFRRVVAVVTMLRIALR